jgi:ABC-2 type transport system permease protein
LSAPLPPELAGWLLAGTGAGVAIAALQLTLSLAIRSFAVPVAIALAGGVAGIAALAKGLGAFWPYTLFALGMSANGPASLPAGGAGQFVASCALFLLAGSLAGIFWLKKRDVATG